MGSRNARNNAMTVGLPRLSVLPFLATDATQCVALKFAVMAGKSARKPVMTAIPTIVQEAVWATVQGSAIIAVMESLNAERHAIMAMSVLKIVARYVEVTNLRVILAVGAIIPLRMSADALD